MEQRSKDWFNARKGIVTASKTSAIMGKKGLGLTGETYARELAMGYLFPDYEPEEFYSADIQRGVELEPLAFEWFRNKVAMNFQTVETCGFFKHSEILGASPDGLVDDDAILEIKAPKLHNFLKVVESNEIPEEYYQQMQTQMLATGRNKGYFVVYAVVNGKEFGHIIEVLQDKPMQELIIERAKQVIEIRDRIINDLKFKLDI